MKSDKWILLLVSVLVLVMAAAVVLTACGDDDDDDDENDDNDAADDDDNDAADDDNDASDDDDDSACDCEIDGECYASGATNPENVCLICDPGQSSIVWSANDFAACDDGLFCNGADTCLSGECVEHEGDPCTTNPWDGCFEETDTCEPDCTIVWTHYYEDCGYVVSIIPGEPKTLEEVISSCESSSTHFGPDTERFQCVVDNWDDCGPARWCIDEVS